MSAFQRLVELTAAGRPCAVATVVRTQGSTPQAIGARLILTADPSERPFGTLGGGCVEADAILALRDVLDGGRSSLRAYQLNEDLAWNSGLVCGGTMWILAERGDTALAGAVDAGVGDVNDAIRRGDPVAIVTRLARRGSEWAFAGRMFVDGAGAPVGTLGGNGVDDLARAAARERMRHGTPARVAAGEGDEFLVEPVLTQPQLVVAGGGHVAKALAAQAQLVGFDVTVLEDRPEFADPSRFGGATVIAGSVPESIAALNAGPHMFLVVATRGHKLDADCVLAGARTRVSYIGLLGSRRKTRLVADLLREHGIADDRLRAIHAPVGLDLGGRSPAEIALAIVAEITQIRYGGSGRKLSDDQSK
jgi:xanthine dehydrogenase accessory factor